MSYRDSQLGGFKTTSITAACRIGSSTARVRERDERRVVAVVVALFSLAAVSATRATKTTTDIIFAAVAAVVARGRRCGA